MFREKRNVYVGKCFVFFCFFFENGLNYFTQKREKKIGNKKIFGKEENNFKNKICNCLDQGTSELTIMIKNALQMLC